MKKELLAIIIIIISSSIARSQYILKSPDNLIEIVVNTDEGIRWSVSYNGKQIILPSSLSMEFTDRVIPGDNFRIRDAKMTTVNEVVVPAVAHKDSSIPENYNQMTLSFRDEYSLHFRAYNDGVAYSFETDFGENVIVLNEESKLFFMEESTSWYPLEESFMSHNERTFIKTSLDTINEDHLASLPVLVRSSGTNILITESGLEDYAGMWIRGAGSNALQAVFPKYPDEEKLFRDRDMRIMKTSDFIAENIGKKQYPWRVFIISPDDAGLVESNLTYLLASPSRIEDISWIKPGKVAWDWWNANNIYGVDFRAGLNNETYKYYIDFASANGIEYVILDEGWYKLGDLFSISPGFDIAELCNYARSKNVGIILWVVWKTFDDQMDRALVQFSEWGVKGIKVDFMQRDDQKMVRYYYRVAEKAAAHRMLVDFHGSYKPSGLRRTWPNVITREGVKGLEHNKWSKDVTPEHDVTLPFTRMVAGPMDYTPGAMTNLEPGNFNPMFTRPASQGTRVHQMALYTIFESPLQMLADNPSNYMREQECTDFITAIPVTWDETIVLAGEIGQYIAIARRKGDVWYMGALAGNDARELTLDAGFLGDGEYRVTIFSDGINADRYVSDYSKSEETFSGGKMFTVKMAPGGGWVARIEMK
jgi:alpha-glucosidase